MTRIVRGKMRNLPASEQARLIDEWVTGQNAQRNRNIMKLYIIHGEGTYELIAERFEISPDQVRKIIKSGCVALEPHLK